MAVSGFQNPGKSCECRPSATALRHQSGRILSQGDGFREYSERAGREGNYGARLLVRPILEREFVQKPYAPGIVLHATAAQLHLSRTTLPGPHRDLDIDGWDSWRFVHRTQRAEQH